MTLQERILSHTMPVPWSGCWLWTGGVFKKSHGDYGQIWMPDGGKFKKRLAHRVSYEAHKGQIPDGHVVDHMCRVKTCVNPAHLRAVTPRINCRENNDSACSLNALKTHCKRGHEFTPENIIKVKGGRSCRECRRALRARIWREQKQ